MSHELLHAWHYALKLPYHNLYSERATSTYSLAYGKAYGMKNLHLLSAYRLRISKYPREHS